MAATLQVIPNVTKLSDRVVRVLGQNPGRFTLQGTNIYLVGKSNPYIMLDVGEGREEFIPILESALLSEAKPVETSLPDVSDIIISHWHHDHVGGLPTVLTLLQKLWSTRNPGKPFTPPRLHKYPLPSSEANNSESKWNVLPKLLAELPKELYTPFSPDAPLHDLHDSQIIQGTSTTLHLLHTPGHTRDSISLYIPEDRALYTADTVLGQGTAVFEDLALYINSLNKMLQSDKSSGSTPNLEYDQLYPSHGPVVTNGRETISMYIKHRLERETQVLQLISGSPPPAPDQHWTTLSIVKNIYASYPEAMWLPAMRGIDLHLKKLEGEGRIKRLGGTEGDTRWAMSRTPSPSL